jgi:hypothetical protein
MRRLAIEINDAAIAVADAGGVLCSEPGVAVVERGRIVTGREAASLARLKPRDTSLTHWANLDITPGSTTVPGRHSTAELAHAQLERIWKETGEGATEVALVVPATLGNDALGVLLGLAEDCRIPVVAIVDAAVAASTKPWPGRQLVYVDAGLHGVLVTPLSQGERVGAEAPVRLDSMGLAGVAEAIARRIAEMFVLATRFDPLHDAATEQRLYDALPAALAGIAREGRATVALADRHETFEIVVETQALLGAVRGFYRAVRQLVAQARKAQAGLVVQLSDRLAGLPGLVEELGRLDAASLIPLPPGHAALSAIAALDSLELSGTGVRLHRRLPWREAPTEATATAAAGASAATAAPAAAPGPAESEEPRPTHVVYRGIAYPVNGEGLLVGRAKLDRRRAIVIEARTEGVSRAHCELAVVDGELRIRDLSSFGTFVNERRIEGVEILKAADVIRIGSPGAELTVVRVEGPDGP